MNTPKIGLFRDPDYAPCSFLIIVVDDDGMPLPYKGAMESNSVLIQSDWDYPSVAMVFGFSTGEDREPTITEASEWLHEKASRADYQWAAEVTAEDPGYFAFAGKL